MTQEEAIKILKDFHDESALFSVRTALETLYPELRESEDERIRKGLINYFNHHKNGINIFYGIKGDDILDWLERQSESSDQIRYWTEEEIEPIISDYLRGAEHYGGMIGRLRCLKPKSLEKQDEQKQEINNFDVLPGLYKCVHRMFDGTPDGRLLFEVGNVYKCLSKHDRAEFEVSYGHSVYLEDPVVCKHFIPFEKQSETYTKRDVDDAWLKGMCDAKRELDKQSDSPIKWNKNTKDCKPKVSHSVLMKTTHGIAEGEWQGEHWHQYRWAGIVRDTDVLSWMELSDLEKQAEQKPIIEMKSAEESLGIDSETYNKIVDECIYGEQKSTWSEEKQKL